MTATLWIDTDNEKTIELGGTLQAYNSFSEMAHLVGPNYLKNYPELFSVMSAVEDQNDVPKDWLEGVRQEASEFLNRYRSRLSSNAIGILDQLIEGDEDDEEKEPTGNESITANDDNDEVARDKWLSNFKGSPHYEMIRDASKSSPHVQRWIDWVRKNPGIPFTPNHMEYAATMLHHSHENQGLIHAFGAGLDAKELERHHSLQQQSTLPILAPVKDSKVFSHLINKTHERSHIPVTFSQSVRHYPPSNGQIVIFHDNEGRTLHIGRINNIHSKEGKWHAHIIPQGRDKLTESEIGAYHKGYKGIDKWPNPKPNPAEPAILDYSRLPPIEKQMYHAGVYDAHNLRPRGMSIANMKLDREGVDRFGHASPLFKESFDLHFKDKRGLTYSPIIELEQEFAGHRVISDDGETVSQFNKAANHIKDSWHDLLKKNPYAGKHQLQEMIHSMSKNKPVTNLYDGGDDISFLNDVDDDITTNDKGQWITIGGHPEGDKKHVGGTRVFIKDGKIQWGNVPKSMIGTAVKDFQENIRSHRKVHEAHGMTPGEKLTEKEWERHLERHDQKKHLGKTREHVKVAHHEVVRQALEEGKDVPRHVVKEVLRQYGRDLPSAIKPETEKQHALEETKGKQRRQELERIQKEREQHESQQKRTTSEPTSSGPSREEAPRVSGRLETETPGPHIPAASEVRGGDHQPVSETSPSHVLSPREAAKLEDVNKRLNRYEQHFRSRGNHKLADWMGLLREHINTVGVQHALDSLDPEVEGKGEKVQYGGHFLEGHHEAEFIEKYLDRAGISLITGSQPEGDRRAISSASESPYEGGLHGRGREEDFFPALQTLRDKLHEAQHLPGLEKSEDLSKLMGGEFGAKVERFAPEVVKKLDETYGEGQWIVKSYGDEAYAGYGIYFPQRAAQVQRDAQNNMWTSGMHLAKYGFSHLRDADGNVVGIKHHNGDEYRFGKVDWDLDEDYRPYIKIEGTPKYNSTIHGEARHWADVAARASLDEQGASFPPGKFMAQPAMPVVGISNEERAQGVTFKKGQEGRVHIVTRNGNVSVVPAATWLKNEPLPVVFGNERTRAMEKAALEAIQQLPLSERSGQIYAPDCVPVKGGGYKVVEANPANMAGGSGYLADNPLVMDAFVAHMVHRQPMHVAFIRKLLTSRRR